MNKIIPVESERRKKEAVKVIRKSNETIAEELGLTIENAPTNPAFLTMDGLNISMNKGLSLYCILSENVMIGCIGIEDSRKDGVFYLERLAVLPEHRHKGIGRKLLDFAFQKVKESGGKLVSIGIIYENTRLRNWYTKYGFEANGIKKFDHLPFTVCFMRKSAE